MDIFDFIEKRQKQKVNTNNVEFLYYTIDNSYSKSNCSDVFV